MSAGEKGAAAATPEIKVLHGNPTAEEVAVVVAVVSAAVAASASQLGNDAGRSRKPSGWTARERGVRAPLHAGPGGWRASAFPRAR
ncbi:acyl-CoA carboxylase epsilon subunit [Catenulispora acidiphila]|uniref:acyl-CoA carboxylase epsilon subunit n=1 Tax=Catenulispora acidiphila TaxID=304895 RepID=UPI000A2F56A2